MQETQLPNNELIKKVHKTNIKAIRIFKRLNIFLQILILLQCVI